MQHRYRKTFSTTLKGKGEGTGKDMFSMLDLLPSVIICNKTDIQYFAKNYLSI